MKKIISKFIIAGAALLATAGLGACSQKSSGPSPLVAESERIGGELAKIAEESPMYIDSATTAYADGVLSINIAFADPQVAVADYSQALVEYMVSQWLKSHLGAGLDTTLNTLSAEDGSLKITLKSADGTANEYTIGHARLKKLLTLKPSELNFSAVKDNVALLMEKRCQEYKDKYKASECTFEFSTGFAQYTLTFESGTMYANLTQDSLRGRYQGILRAQFDVYGACAPMAYELVKSLGIEGYRFVYEADGGKTLKAALPWRIIE